ncbi:MAG: hypothetical protein KIS94_11735 [Chitinophagales bacterium]|nr:hypothetical protein [Chitinophagales bacterium]
MEFKVVIYIILGILYFIYSVSQKRKEQQQATPQPQKEKPITPPAYDPLKEIMKEIQRKQAEEQARKTIKQKPKPAYAETSKPVKTKGRDVLLHEKKVTTFQEGMGSLESVYERELTEEEKIERGTLKIQNEGAYKIESIEEAEAKEAQQSYAYEFDARNAVISSIILERKF